jgi:glycine cleavage system aminomethyltransferase T
VAHVLVGLAFESASPPEPGTRLEVEGRRVGEVTSAASSATLGAIGLGFVTRVQSAPGTRLQVGDAGAHVVELPFRESRARESRA